MNGHSEGKSTPTADEQKRYREEQERHLDRFYGTSGSLARAGSLSTLCTSTQYVLGPGGIGTVYLLDRTLEPETRDIMEAMGGRQPTPEEWRYLFDPEWRGGSLDTAIVEKMRQAHSVAIAGFRRQAKQET